MVDFKKQGKKNRASGSRFELKVRKDLESKGWVVSKWQNNVDLPTMITPLLTGKLIPAKRKFNPFNKVMMMSGGFPDFIAFRRINNAEYKVIGVEVKSNGYLSKEEKEKCNWYLGENIFNAILIASKGKKEIIYNVYE